MFIWQQFICYCNSILILLVFILGSNWMNFFNEGSLEDVRADRKFNNKVLLRATCRSSIFTITTKPLTLAYHQVSCLLLQAGTDGLHFSTWKDRDSKQIFSLWNKEATIHLSSRIALRPCNREGMYVYMEAHDCVCTALVREIQHHLENSMVIYAYLPRMGTCKLRVHRCCYNSG